MVLRDGRTGELDRRLPVTNIQKRMEDERDQRRVRAAVGRWTLEAEVDGMVVRTAEYEVEDDNCAGVGIGDRRQQATHWPRTAPD